MIIYKITNKLNGKSYIGQTKRTVAQRVKRHIYERSKIGKEILENGIENFSIDVIDNASNQTELDELEKFWISLYNTQDNGYNTLCGGKPTKKELKLLSKIKKRRPKRKKMPVEKEEKIVLNETEIKFKIEIARAKYNETVKEQIETVVAIESLKNYPKSFFV